MSSDKKRQRPPESIGAAAILSIGLAYAWDVGAPPVWLWLIGFWAGVLFFAGVVAWMEAS